jgi:dTDP-4-dehydrorhamnose reductase
MVSKIILFGNTGMLGNYIYKYFTLKQFPIETISTNEYTVSMETFENLEEILIKKRIDSETCVINCIGIIPQRMENKKQHDYYVINGVFPHILWSVCKRYSAKMIQPTTDCVFSGKVGSYTEINVHDETNNYGISKSIGEPFESTVIRSSIIGRELFNKKSLLEFVIKNEGNTIQGWDNHMWNGITCLQYCKVIEKIIIDNLFWKGVRHILSPTPVSKYELVNIIKHSFNININIQRTSTETNIDKTLRTIYNENNTMNIPELSLQLKELALFSIE